MKMFKLKTNGAGAAIAGNYLAISGANFKVIDLRCGSKSEDWSPSLVGYEKETAAEIGDVIHQHLYDADCKTPSDEEYKIASEHTDWRIRSLAALNVKVPGKLSKDSEDGVVVNLMHGLLNDRRYGVSHDNTRWLDALTTHPSSEVRCLVAQYGKKEHLDVLVNDNHHEVLVQVAMNGYAEHLDKLVLHPNEKVRNTVIKVGTEAHCLQVLNDDSGVISAEHINRYLIDSIIRTGYATTEVLSDDKRRYEHGFMLACYGKKEAIESSDLFLHKATDVRVELAKRGLFLDKLVHDQRHEVRKEVAKWGIRQHLLVLINDIDARVRLEVAKLKFTREQI